MCDIVSGIKVSEKIGEQLELVLIEEKKRKIFTKIFSCKYCKTKYKISVSIPKKIADTFSENYIAVDELMECETSHGSFYR